MNRLTRDKKTILFSGHDFRFLRPFLAHCEANPCYSVLLDEHKGHEITNPDRCRQLLPGAEIIFCEWCLGNAVWYSRHKSPGQRLLIRLHAQEMRLPFLDQVQWENVDALILICPRNLELIRERYPFLQHKTHLIYNPIDCNTLSQPKLPGAEFNLGIMGICPMLKAPHLALEILVRLKERDHRYTLYVKGKHPKEYDWLWRRPNEREYYETFFKAIDSSPYANSVVFEGYGEDVSVWLSKIGFILSTSDFEGSHQSVAEGMAAGAIPVIRNWPGSALIYPPKYVIGSVEEAAKAIVKWKRLGTYDEEANFCREYARQNFDQGGVCERLEKLFAASAPAEEGQVSGPGCLSMAASPIGPVMILCYLPAGCRGGYRIRIEQEVKSLKRKGCVVHLACLHPKTAEASSMESHRAELEALGCTVHLVPMADFFDIKLKAEVIRQELEALQAIIKTNGLQIVHAEALYCARIGLILKELRSGLRLVFDCHGTSPHEERMSGAHPARVSAMQEFERRVLAGADLNIFVSEAMSRFYLDQYGFAELPHVVLPCCVAAEQFPEKTSPSALRLPGNRPLIAYLGTMAAWQCGEEMIRLMAQLREEDPEMFFLLLVPQADHAKSRERLLKHKLPEQNFLLAELPHHEVASTLQYAHAGLLLRRAHPVNQVSSPTKFAEYLAAGVPVIMTDGIGDFSNLATEKKVGLVLESALLDAAEYPARSIRQIAEFARNSMRQRDEVAARCRTIARNVLSWDVASGNLIRGYRSIGQIGEPSANSSTNPALVGQL